MLVSLNPVTALAILGALLPPAQARAQEPAPPPVQEPAPPPPAQEPEAPPPAPPAPIEAAVAAPESKSEWLLMLERDRRTSFNAHSAELALAALADGLDPMLRPVALFALGASGERAMGPRLESWAIEGTPADRRAAILGLCESGY